MPNREKQVFVLYFSITLLFVVEPIFPNPGLLQSPLCHLRQHIKEEKEVYGDTWGLPMIGDPLRHLSPPETAAPVKCCAFCNPLPGEKPVFGTR